MNYDEIKRGLLSYHPIEKRWECEKIGAFNIINDSYNANPESMKASVSTFLELYKNPVVVLGNMGELGDDEVEFHKEVGRFLGKKFGEKPQQKNNTPIFLVVGDLASQIGNELENFGLKVEYFKDNIATSRYILDNINAGSTIFLKASRAMKFEEILESLKTKV
jgi:UDP-N-acetylmuramoyl-tripeptide--D-alanyl-D-alanine ligase